MKFRKDCAGIGYGVQTVSYVYGKPVKNDITRELDKVV